MIRRVLLRTLVPGAVACLSGCSVLLDWNSLTGGAGSGTDAAADTAADTAAGETGPDSPSESAPTTCAGSMSCVAAPPAGWSGPVELYTGTTAQGAPPACGPGFAATPAFDGNAGLTAPSSTCTSCGCSSPAGGSCAGPVITFYIDSSCGTEVPIQGTQTVTSSCSATNPVAQSLEVAAPVATGGTCAGTGGTATTPPAAWSRVARACSPSSTAAGGVCGSGRVCAPVPGSAFSTSACVLQAGVATACPPSYPAGPQVFYSGLDDQRACSACQCSAPTGATCTIGTPAITSCIDSTTLGAPNACTALSNPDTFKLASTPTLSSPGSCSVSGGGAPAGNATPNGATSFCCAP
ncbi:MAG TPA: hypothetical protein VIF09_17135 [Polyangiaceae bacterium]